MTNVAEKLKVLADTRKSVHQLFALHSNIPIWIKSYIVNECAARGYTSAFLEITEEEAETLKEAGFDVLLVSYGASEITWG